MIEIKNSKEQMFLVEYANNENVLQELNEALEKCGYELDEYMGASIPYSNGYISSVLFLLPDTYYSFQKCNYFFISNDNIIGLTSLSKLVEFLDYYDIKLY